MEIRAKEVSLKKIQKDAEDNFREDISAVKP